MTIPFPGVPHSFAEDLHFLRGLSDGTLDDLVAECAMLVFDPWFFLRVVESVEYTYDRWHHSIPRSVQLAATALRRTEACGADPSLAWFRAVEGRALLEELV